MNGHMAGVGDKPTSANFEHGVQVIDGDKEFKYVRHRPLQSFLQLLAYRIPPLAHP